MRSLYGCDTGYRPSRTQPGPRPQARPLGGLGQFGCLVRITGLSLSGGFGSPPKSACTRLLDRGLVHVVASDAHDPSHRSPDLSPAYNSIRDSYGADVADLLFTENPQGIVEGPPLKGGKLTLQDGQRPPHPPCPQGACRTSKAVPAVNSSCRPAPRVHHATLITPDERGVISNTPFAPLSEIQSSLVTSPREGFPRARKRTSGGIVLSKTLYRAK